MNGMVYYFPIHSSSHEATQSNLEFLIRRMLLVCFGFSFYGVRSMSKESAHWDVWKLLKKIPCLEYCLLHIVKE